MNETKSAVETFTNHKAADFMNAGGESIVSLQLLNKNGHAIAIADFRANKLERFDCAPAVVNRAKEWLSVCMKMLHHQLDPKP